MHSFEEKPMQFGGKRYREMALRYLTFVDFGSKNINK